MALLRTLNSILVVAVLVGCAVDDRRGAPQSARSDVRVTDHRGDDDLLTAGLGLAGLRAPAPQLAGGAADAQTGLRRLAIHANYRGLADLTVTGGFDGDATFPVVPGREYQAFVTLPGARHPFRVLLQLPDSFDPDDACLIVAPVSGSRGIYGAVPVVGPWALPRGCAVAATDKGAGTDLFDHASETGVRLDGTRAGRGAELGLEPGPVDAPLVSVPHAHSGDHPEADWGRHAIEAARFALDVLGSRYPDHAPFEPGEIRVIAAAISNGGGAALRALEESGPGLFDGAVIAAPNVAVPGARPLFDYATLAALFQPCLLAAPDVLAQLPFGSPQLLGVGRQRCATLAAAGLIDEAAPAAARRVLAASGFDDGALEQAAVNTTLDVWRSVAAMYASAYLRAPVDAMPCGYRVAVVDDDGAAVPAEPVQRRLWWATSSGVVPGSGVEWIDALAGDAAQDPAFPGLRCLRRLWTGDGESARTLRAAVDATRATAELPDVPVVILHGRQDGLVPAAFSARPYVAAARDNGARRLAYWEIDGAQHFDVIVPFPGLSTRYRPLLPYLWQGLEHVGAVLDGRTELGGDRIIDAIGD